MKKIIALEIWSLSGIKNGDDIYGAISVKFVKGFLDLAIGTVPCIAVVI